MTPLRDSKRITILLDDNNRVKLRKLQARKIRKTKESCSFSKIMNLVIEEGLKRESRIIKKMIEAREK